MKAAMNKLYFGLSVIFVFFHLYTALFGVLPGIGQRVVHLCLILSLYFLSSLAKADRPGIGRLLDFLCIAATVASSAYIMSIEKMLDFRAGVILPADIVFGLMLVVVMLIACWRTVGSSLTIVVIVFIAYAFAGPYLPGMLAHSGMSIGKFSHIAVLTTDGIFGTPLYASAAYVVLFIILGALFNETGVGDYFTSLSTAAFGKMVGGPAKVAVIASGLFGSINGSAIANVLGTGTFTIPMMKRAGFEPKVAGAVEASASVGGQIMPPIMGATAFLMAELIGVSYYEVAKAAAIPAILYFVSILMTVDIYARKMKLGGSVDAVPSLNIMIRKAYLFSPLVLLVILLVQRMTVTRAGIYTIIFTCIIVMLNKESRVDWPRFVKIIEGSVSGATSVAISCGIVGIVIGMVMATGLGFRLSGILIDLAAGRLLVLLVLTMICSIILGMGVPTTAAYLVLAVLVAPALIKMGISAMAAHMFVLYFGIVSGITPPVALAAYTAAGLAKCSPNECGWQAFRLALAGFIMPFMFIYNPSLLLMGHWTIIVRSVITSLIGVYCLASALEGFTIKWRINMVQRVMLFAAALLLIDSGLVTDLAGAALIIVVLGDRLIRSKKQPTEASI